MSYIDICNKYANYFLMPESDKKSDDYKTTNQLLQLKCINELLDINTVSHDNDNDYERDENNSRTIGEKGSKYIEQETKTITLDGVSKKVNIYYPNNLKTVFTRIRNNFLELSQAITDAFNNLFTDYDQDYYSDTMQGMNFTIINGYAESSKNYEKYNESTMEFSKITDYWYTRGHYYELIPKGMIGEYITSILTIPEDKRKDFNNETNYCDYIYNSYFKLPYLDTTYEDDYEEYKQEQYLKWLDACAACVPDENGKITYPEEPDYADDYWLTEYGLKNSQLHISYNDEDETISTSKLAYVNNHINSLLNPVWEITTWFKRFKSEQKFYIQIFETYQSLIGRINLFLNNEDKSSSSVEYNLYDIYDIDYDYGVFANYSPSINYAYSIFRKAKNEAERIYQLQKSNISNDYHSKKILNEMSSYCDSYDIESAEKTNLTSKLATYYTLCEYLLTYNGKRYNYWSIAPVILNWIIQFRKKYSLTTIER